MATDDASVPTPSLIPVDQATLRPPPSVAPAHGVKEALQNCSCDRTSFGGSVSSSVSFFTFGTGSLPEK